MRDLAISEAMMVDNPITEVEPSGAVEGIAIVGMAGRFPGAANVDEFWRNLRDGVESIAFFTDEELAAIGIEPELLNNPNFVKAHGALEEIELFDAAFFGIPPREAEIMDPQHRLFLECAWTALENAGYDTERYAGAIGIFAGVGVNSYAIFNLFTNSAALSMVSTLQTSIRNRTDHLTTQVAYKLNLKGPGITVQTACSTSLVAVHLACQSLLNGECDMALAGGVSLSVPQKGGYLYQEGGILSPDGHCRSFDAQAQGTVGGSGVGIVVLKRLEDALANGDTIYAVIRGSAINNDGARKVGYTAPGVDGQANVIAEALAVADVEPETIGYIETHGTGTALGDPIEVEALTRAFGGPLGADTDETGFCAIGAVKSNVGHLDTAAGVTGLIKTALALKHKQIPPSLHYQQPNPRIDFANSPFYVNTELTDWPRNGTLRRAGVSSFGIGGTNAHIVLEEAPEEWQVASGKWQVAGADGPPQSSSPWQLLVLSAKTSGALEKATANLANYINLHPEVDLADVAYTLQVGRRAFGHRRVIVCQGDSAVKALETLDPTLVYTSFQEPRERPVVFMFTGQGSQYVNMGRDLYEAEPRFRASVDHCCELLQAHLGFDLRTVLYPDDRVTRWQGDQMTEETLITQSPSHPVTLSQTAVAQPALFVVEYALAQLWMAWGVRPAAMIGHSIGEYVAACLAGVFTLEEALTLVTARGRLMQELPAGSMLSVALPEAEVQPLLGNQLSLAAVNGTAMCVVAGPTTAVDALEEQLTARGVGCRRLHTSHAFHSQMMEPMLAPFLAEVQKVNLQPPQIPYLSNVTGGWISAEEATDPTYWTRHVRQTVRFVDGIQELVKEPDWLLLEVGPGITLLTFARWHPHRAAGQTVVSSLRPPTSTMADLAYLLTTLGRLWLAGVPVDWESFHDHSDAHLFEQVRPTHSDAHLFEQVRPVSKRHRLPLPTYPFERQRYWVEAQPLGRSNGHGATASLHKKPNIDDWFYVPSWKRKDLGVTSNRARSNAAETPPTAPRWLLFIDELGLGTQMAEQLRQLGETVITVASGEAFTELGADTYALNSRRREEYDTLLQTLHAQEKLPTNLLHLWGVTDEDPTAVTSEAGARALDLGFYSLLYLAQALGSQGIEEPLQVGVITNNLHEVIGGEMLWPEKATVLGPCRAISKEFSNVTCRAVDIVLPTDHTRPLALLADQLLGEFSHDAAESVVACRGRHRWVQTFEPAPLPSPSNHPPVLREGGVYLITGGLGGIGLELAAYLARTVQANLVLIGRSPLPAREQWEEWLALHGEEDATSRKIRKVQHLEELGAAVLTLQADVTDLAQMRAVVDQTHERFGPIHGVIHAAGVAGGGLLQLKSPAMAADVLAPKVQGTRVLESVLAAEPLDFAVLCSSRAAILGGFGQADYCAANAFLDAFAHYQATRQGPRTIAINWAGWEEVGMRVDTLARLGMAAPQTLSGLNGATPHSSAPYHPLLERLISQTPEQEVYATEYNITKHWVIDDHRILKRAVVPGVAYLEMARAALEKHAGDRAIQLRNIFFLAAVDVRDDETREVRTVLEKLGDGFAFRMLSKRTGSDTAARNGNDAQWQEYALGRAEIVDAEPVVHDLSALIARCNRQEIVATDEPLTHDDLGPHWQNLRRAYIGEHEMVTVLELAEEYVADLATYKLHPALLDRTNGAAKTYLFGSGLYMPMGYKRILIKAPLPRTVYAYHRFRPEADPSLETINFDVILMDETGRELVVLDTFSQKKVNVVADPVKRAAGGGALDATSNGQVERVTQHESTANAASQNGAAQPNVSNAMSPSEGVEAFRRILATQGLPQIITSPNDLLAALEQAQAFKHTPVVETHEESAAPKPTHARPNINTAYVAPRNKVESQIAEIWQATLGIDQVGIHDNFFDLGGDSVVGIQMLSKFNRAGFQLSPQQLFQHQTIAELAAALETAETAVEPTTAQDPMPLTPAQQQILAQICSEACHQTGALWLEAQQPLDARLFQESVRHLMQRHTALRLHFIKHGTEATPDWRQRPAAVDLPIPFTVVDLSAEPCDKQQAAMAAQQQALAAAIDIKTAPLLHFALFDLGTAQPQQLLVMLHPLIADLYSWPILLADLAQIYQQLAAGEAVVLPAPTPTWQEWMAHLTAHAQSPALPAELPYWLDNERNFVASLPVDELVDDQSGTAFATAIIKLDRAETERFRQTVSGAYGIQAQDLLLAALVQTLADWTEEERFLVQVTGNGRTLLSDGKGGRSVGPFLFTFPALFALSEDATFAKLLKTVKEQLRQAPNGGIGYGLLRHWAAHEASADQLALLPEPEVWCTYLGDLDGVTAKAALLQPCDWDAMTQRLLPDQQTALLGLNALIAGGELQLVWLYQAQAYQPETIAELAQGFTQVLDDLIEQCQEDSVGAYTPSDFGLANLDQQQLDKLLAQFH